MKKFCLTSILILSLIFPTLKAQYYSDRPLEMTFEQSDLFFRPSFLNPLGTENFGAASVLTSEQPLIALQRNPANLSQFDGDTLPSNYYYLDFRNTREIVKSGYGGIFPGYSRYSPGIIYPGWGYYHTTSRSEMAPIISAAYLTRLPLLNKSVTLGATYQLIAQAEGYYAVPHDIYKNLAGRSLDGVAYAGLEDYDITDRFSGSDDMYHEGHSINTFLAWEINDAISIGLKIGHFIFDREGSLGSDNLWAQQIDYMSYWKSSETRIQEYRHWDYSLGLNYSASDYRAGFYAGMVRGNVVQDMARDDESLSQYGQRGSLSWSDYQNWSLSDQNWDHSGTTVYAGLQWERRIREDLSFRFMYNYSGLSQDIGLGSSIESESENEYYYESLNSLGESEGYSNMHDYRTGSGDRTVKNNIIKSAMRWKVRDNQTLSVGAILGVRNQSTRTTERVDAFSETYSYWHNEYNSTINTYEYYIKTVEDKTINWEFDSRLRSLQIPVIYEYNINERFDLMVGINRRINFWKTENKTLILYDYRERVNNSEVNIETKTGERISEPNERLNIITTGIIGGLTFSPSKAFSVQIVATPGFEKNSLTNEHRTGLQFWLGMSLRP